MRAYTSLLPFITLALALVVSASDTSPGGHRRYDPSDIRSIQEVRSLSDKTEYHLLARTSNNEKATLNNAGHDSGHETSDESDVEGYNKLLNSFPLPPGMKQNGREDAGVDSKLIPYFPVPPGQNPSKAEWRKTLPLSAVSHSERGKETPTDAIPNPYVSPLSADQRKGLLQNALNSALKRKIPPNGQSNTATTLSETRAATSQHRQLPNQKDTRVIYRRRIFHWE